MEIVVTHEFDLAETYWEIWWPHAPLQDTVDAIVEDTKIRLDDDEHGPDGKRWEPWSDNPPGAGYASTRGPEHKLLFSTGELRDSIEAGRSGDAHTVTSDRVYAEVHQWGSRDGRIIDRPYVGVSADVERALDEMFDASYARGWGRISG
jgi:hypothetical protein